MVQNAEQAVHRELREWLARTFHASRGRTCGEYFELRQLDQDTYEIVPFPRERAEPLQPLVEEERTLRDELWERLPTGLKASILQFAAFNLAAGEVDIAKAPLVSIMELMKMKLIDLMEKQNEDEK